MQFIVENKLGVGNLLILIMLAPDATESNHIHYGYISYCKIQHLTLICLTNTSSAMGWDYSGGINSLAVRVGS